MAAGHRRNGRRIFNIGGGKFLPGWELIHTETMSLCERSITWSYSRPSRGAISDSASPSRRGSDTPEPLAHRAIFHATRTCLPATAAARHPVKTKDDDVTNR
ncbi:hypothetical protein Mth01_23610 [Sphaerimonospora thailandensis]|uniref:Uncharacterized protein n=1 Tax=Sphaerimonospora thailandensis TaxID=795644 RepID=A0A8J3RCP0_9ACTN|nr:hypothetical protein Mth01_23610 [Sphaerimonospora thailandensis]